MYTCTGTVLDGEGRRRRDGGEGKGDGRAVGASHHCRRWRFCLFRIRSISIFIIIYRFLFNLLFSFALWIRSGSLADVSIGVVLRGSWVLYGGGASEEDEFEGHLFELAHQLGYDIEEAKEEFVDEGRVVYPYQPQRIQHQLELRFLEHRIDFVPQQLLKGWPTFSTLRVLWTLREY